MKYLVIGASGFLGETVYKILKDKNEKVVGTYFSNKKIDELIYLDVLDTHKLLDLYYELQPEVIIWSVMNIETEEDIAEKSIFPLVKQMHNTRFIFISTSVAYEENMAEDIEPLARTDDMYHYHYFNGKVKAENHIKTYDNYVIVRPGSIYGKNPYGLYDNRTKILKEHIDRKEEYIRATNIIFSIVEVNDLAKAIIELAENEYIGIINVSEEIPISHYDFNTALCKYYGFDYKYVMPNIEKMNTYYLDNSLRKKILKFSIKNLAR